MNISNDDSNSIQDLVIQSMFAHRSTSLDNVDPDNENERRRRLQTLLKTSKKYKRIAVKLANDQWDSELSSDQMEIVQRIRRVSFSDSIQVIPHDSPKKMPESLIRLIKSIFKLVRN